MHRSAVAGREGPVRGICSHFRSKPFPAMGRAELPHAGGMCRRSGTEGGLPSRIGRIIARNQAELIAEEEKPDCRNLGAALAYGTE